jgi:lipoate-protein ligase A
MASDQAMLDVAESEGRSLLRLYTWEPACLSFGRNEAALRRYDRERIAALGLDVVRRPTGGRAVWHSGELTYAVAAPLGRYGSLAEAYCRIHTMLAVALRRIGAEVSLAPRRTRPSALHGACFADPVGGEIVARGRKLVGSAQLRQGNAFLQHGSILITGSQETVALVSRTPSPTGGEITLEEILGGRVAREEVAEAIRVVATDLEETHEVAEAAPRHGERHRSADWIWRR